MIKMFKGAGFPFMPGHPKELRVRTGISSVKIDFDRFIKNVFKKYHPFRIFFYRRYRHEVCFHSAAGYKTVICDRIKYFLLIIRV